MAEADAEDEDELAQWMPICDDCDNPVEHYCTTCGDKLCTDCKDHHLSKRRTRDHQFVPYSAGMKAAQKSTTPCTKHPGEKYQMYCKTCQIPVCTPCVTQSHSGHDFMSILDAFSVSKEKAISNLEILTTKVRPRVKDDCEKVNRSEADAMKTKSMFEQAIRHSAKELHSIVDTTQEEKLTQLTEMMETSTMSVLRKQKEDSDNLHRNVEKAIKEYEDYLRSSDPIDLLNYMKGRESEDPEALFPPLVMEEILLPRFQAGSKLREVIQDQFGSITLPKTQNITPIEMKEKPAPQIKTLNSAESVEKKTETTDKTEGRNLGQRLMEKAEQLNEFTISTTHISFLGKLRHVKPDKIWISAASGGRNVVLANRDGKVLRTIDVKCKMYDYSGIDCTKDGELIFCDENGKSVKKISSDFRVLPLFTTGNLQPRSIRQLLSGDLDMCISDARVLRVYDSTGKFVRELGRDHLTKPDCVAVNRANNELCVSENNNNKVVVFSSNGEKRFTYTGNVIQGTKFDPFDLCCDHLGNILITDYMNHRVHIIDRDGHFLKYLVSGEENISYPVTIDIDDMGYALVGEKNTRKVKVFKYLS